jgi:hypothetical protein
MTAFNTVRFRVKAGREQDFLDAHRDLDWPGLSHANIIRTGDRSYASSPNGPMGQRSQGPGAR